DFLFNADRDFVRNCQTPMVVLMGSDAYHPEVSSREVAELAPHAVFIEKWKEPEHQPAAKQIIERVLAENTPS
ncbi:MAG: alpha/beta hydrolase, partial [Candidatus Tectomicrobia bacterium]